MPSGTRTKSPLPNFFAVPPSIPLPVELSPFFVGFVSLPPVTIVPPPPRSIDYIGTSFLPGAVVTINVVYEIPSGEVSALLGYLDDFYFAL